MQLEARKYLYDIQQAASLIVQFTDSKTFADYRQDIIEQKLPSLRQQAVSLMEKIAESDQ